MVIIGFGDRKEKRIFFKNKDSTWINGHNFSHMYVFGESITIKGALERMKEENEKFSNEKKYSWCFQLNKIKLQYKDFFREKINV
jgi:hypothetical protein